MLISKINPMIKNFLCALVALFIFSAHMVAQTGLTCDDPIPVNGDYTAVIDGPCTLWYTAGTYDLPITVHFAPNSQNSSYSPVVELDLTCTPGVYDDPKVHELVTMAEGFNIKFPVKSECNKVDYGNGRIEWDFPVNSSYRDQLASFGVTYNVTAFVKVSFPEAGRIYLKPDTLFRNCMENAQYLHLGDTISILSNHLDRVFVVPMTDWKEDSIQFVWTGSEPANFYVATTRCEFTPESTDPSVIASYELQPNQPFKIKSKEMKDIIDKHENGGLYYGKCVAAGNGQLIIEKIPLSPIQGNAILMEYDKPISLKANDNTLYCFPRSWEATQFVANTQFITKAYMSNSIDFTATDESQNLLSMFAFSLVDNKRELSLSSKEMTQITAKASDDYIYVRFQCAQATTIIPSAWDASLCADNSTTITSKSFSVPAKSSNTVYRLYYEDWKGYDMKVTWMSGTSLKMYIADTCSFFLSSTGPEVVFYSSIAKQKSITIPASTIDGWAERVDADGFLYVRLNCTNQGTITFTTSKPAEVDPEIPVIPTSPCVVNSIELKAGDQITLNLDSAFTVYRINYSQWVATGATLTWTGLEPLHTFVAETCEFAVAPYNKYVHAYVSVPAEGAAVLDAAKLTEMAAYVDEDGYLYIRFLTEKEGVLEVK